jgi:hypothetical protein
MKGYAICASLVANDNEPVCVKEISQPISQDPKHRTSSSGPSSLHVFCFSPSYFIISSPLKLFNLLHPTLPFNPNLSPESSYYSSHLHFHQLLLSTSSLIFLMSGTHSGNALYSYSGGPRFEYRPGQRLS